MTDTGSTSQRAPDNSWPAPELSAPDEMARQARIVAELFATRRELALRVRRHDADVAELELIRNPETLP